MVEVSIVMPCHNRAYGLHRILQAYEQQKGGEAFEIIAVDDASVDTTYDLLTSYRPEGYTLHIERLKENRGPAAARNLGVSLASGPLILFADDDILPDPFFVHGHLAAHRFYPDPKTAILGRVVWAKDMPANTLMSHIDGIGAQQFSYRYLQNGQEYDFRHFYTANISINKEFLLSAGKLFDTDFRYAFEDGELSYRLSKRGMRIIYSSLLLGFHYHYHTVWSFSARQYRAGKMAVLLVKKHPELRGVIMGDLWHLKALRWRLQAMLHTYPPGLADRLENECLHLLGAHEWTPHPQLDQIYIRSLGYFYFKGLIDGTFGASTTANRVHNLRAFRVLSPILKLL
jgi:glycosyltransferase involved in cell wall biosynthesis